MIVDGKTYEFSKSSALYRNSKNDIGVALGGTEINVLVDINDKVEITKVDGKVALEIKEVEVANLKAQITTAVTAPSKTNLNNVIGLTHKAEADATSTDTPYFDMYQTEVKDKDIKTFDALQSAINAANAKVEKDDEEAAGTDLNSTLGSMVVNTATNKDVKEARETYNGLTTAGKAKVTAANLTKLEEAEKALADAKAALKAEISTAEGIFANENSKLKAIEADDALIANIKTVASPDGSGEPDAYRTLVNALNTARATAASKKVDADSETSTSIGAYTTALTGAIEAVTNATENFDSIVKQAKEM